MREKPAHQGAHKGLAISGRMAAALAHPELDCDPIGAPVLKVERPGFRPRHVLVQVEGGLGLWLFWPVAAGDASSCRASLRARTFPKV